MPAWLDGALMDCAELCCALLPAGQPDGERLRHVRVISHRGERDNRHVYENSFAAFDPLRESGVWGIECDVRWSADGVPMVFHDADFRRLFADPAPVHTLSRDQIQARHPTVPTLAELAARYAGRFHLMVEIKAGVMPAPDVCAARLREALAPAGDHGWHLLCLEPALLDRLPGIGPGRTIGVARTNVEQISRDAAQRGRAGIGVPHPLLRDHHIRRHQRAGQRVGVGFPWRPRVLRRLICRGVTWIFTNRALAVQRELDRLRQAAGLPPTRDGAG